MEGSGASSYETPGGKHDGDTELWNRVNATTADILSNIYLHYVLDEWFAQDVQPRMKGQVFLIRYVDDFVMGFTDETEARRVMDVLTKRFGKYGLTIHPDKTRLIPFRRPPRTSRQDDSDHGGPGTFDLLGFTHYRGLSLKGNWVVKRKTAKDRFSRALRTIHQGCKAHRHQPLAEQQQALSQKMRGHYAYYGVTGNAYALSRFQDLVQRIWRTWLGRRKRDGQITWEVFKRLLRRYPLPMAVVVHSVYRRAAKS